MVGRFSRHKKLMVEDYSIVFGLACLLGLSIVITLMGPYFVASADFYREATVDPSIMNSPRARKVAHGNTIAMKMIFRYADSPETSKRS